MKIPDQHYIGMIANRSAGESMDQLPLAFMTPYGEDKAFEKRKDTVTQWVRQNSRGHTIDPIIVKNEPLVGFRVLGCVSRMGGHKWRVEDPRGFELEISSDNMLALIQQGVIDNSELLEPCIWARGRSDNFLLPITSEEYQNAVAATSLSKKSVGMRDIAVGYMITLQNGTKGRYAGQLVFVHRRSGDEFEEISRHVLVDEESKIVYAVSGLKIAEINETQKWTSEEALVAARANIDFTERWGNVSSATHIACVMLLPKGMGFAKKKIKIKSKMEQGSVFFYQEKYYSIGFMNHQRDFDANPIDAYLWEKDSVILRISDHFSSRYLPNRSMVRLNLATLEREGVETYLTQWVITADDGFITEFI